MPQATARMETFLQMLGNPNKREGQIDVASFKRK